MNITIIQLDSGEDKESNIQKAQDYSIEAAKQGANIVCLPECFLYQGDDKEKEIEQLSSNYITAFQELARQQHVHIVLGSIALACKIPGKVTNTSLVINNKGEIVYRYDKIYLYTVERKDVTYRESDSVEPGSEPGVFELDGITMGIGICFDLRYPEYFRELARQGAEIVFLPSNFRKVTGEIAWDVLTKARAIENQLYFCACGQTGNTGVKERCGNSRIISYDGTIISQMGQEEGIISATLDPESLRTFRKEFPVLKQMKAH